MTSVSREPPMQTALWRFLAPRHWPTWLGLGFMRLLVKLPYRLQMKLGRLFGRLAWRFAARDRRIAAVNLRLCLSELTAAERQHLIRRHFESLGCALFETALVWWAARTRLQPLLRFEGLDHLQRASGEGRGAILLSAHFTTLEVGACAQALQMPTAIMYQTPRNALIAEFSRRSRARLAARTIASDNVRELLRSLKDALPVWYAPDQRETGRASAIVPFFGVPAATNVATTRIAKISGAPVLPFFPERLADGSGYLIRIGAPLAGFPSDDAISDAARFHALIEAHVRRCPEQYLWTYKRFRLPGPDGNPYRG